MSPSTSEPAPVSAYIPCYNNAKTIELAIQGIQNQTRPANELFVVDDGSTDNSVEIVEGLGVRVVRMGKNQGRGAVRAQAMEAARNEFVLCCDATNQLAANFMENALKWFASDDVLAVYGRWFDRHARTVVDRWRARHLFLQEIPQTICHGYDLSTHGAIMRKSAALRVGNYNRLLRHGEDFDLGVRLHTIGDVIYDPNLEVAPVAHNTLFQVMERFTRWNRAAIKNYTLTNFVESHVVAWRILIPRDIEKQDWLAALISATVPYFAIAYADKRSFEFSANSRTKEVPTLRTRN